MQQPRQPSAVAELRSLDMHTRRSPRPAWLVTVALISVMLNVACLAWFVLGLRSPGPFVSRTSADSEVQQIITRLPAAREISLIEAVVRAQAEVAGADLSGLQQRVKEVAARTRNGARGSSWNLGSAAQDVGNYRSEGDLECRRKRLVPCALPVWQIRRLPAPAPGSAL